MRQNFTKNSLFYYIFSIFPFQRDTLCVTHFTSFVWSSPPPDLPYSFRCSFCIQKQIIIRANFSKAAQGIIDLHSLPQQQLLFPSFCARFHRSASAGKIPMPVPSQASSHPPYMPGTVLPRSLPASAPHGLPARSATFRHPHALPGTCRNPHDPIQNMPSMPARKIIFPAMPVPSREFPCVIRRFSLSRNNRTLGK